MNNDYYMSSLVPKEFSRIYRFTPFERTNSSKHNTQYRYRKNSIIDSSLQSSSSLLEH